MYVRFAILARLFALVLVAIFELGDCGKIASQKPLANYVEGFASLNGGTTGGLGGPTVYVSNESELNAALGDDVPRIIKITKAIPLSALVRVGSNKSILGSNANAGISGTGFYIRRKRNVIIRGLKIFNPIAPDDSISVDESTNVWIDHNEFYSDLLHGRDYYDGLLDIKHGADFITISYNKFHNHYKVSLIGHSNKNAAKDTGKLRVTLHHNWFYDVNSRLPSLRFGTGHIYNNVYERVESSCINSRMGAQVLVDRNIFISSKRPISTNLDTPVQGFAVQRDNNFHVQPDIMQWGNFTNPPYHYQMHSLQSTEETVKSSAGNTISFP